MAYNTKAIVKDYNQKPVPQYYNADSDVYEVLEGLKGGNKVILFDINGNKVDLAALIASIVTAIKTTATVQLREGTNNIGKVEVSALPTGASTSANQSSIIAELSKIHSRDETVTHYLNSSDSMPMSNNKKGDKCFVIDADEVSMWNGSAWVVI